MSNKLKMNICLASDDEYSKYMGTAMVSILNNSLDDEEIVFHLLDGGISKENKDNLLSLKNIKNCEIYFYTPDIKKYETWYLKSNSENWSPATFYRLSIPSIIPNVDKILYLDCDVIVNLSLRELFEIDIENYYALVCKEDWREEGYFNAGVLMINNKLWKESNIEEVFCEYYNKNYINYGCLDQDLLNDVLKGKVKIIDKKWNFFPMINNKPLGISMDDYIEANKKSIIHYIYYKPWDEESISVGSIYFNYYWQHYMSTPWFKDYKELTEILLKQYENNSKDVSDLMDKLLMYKNFIKKLAWWIPIKKLRDKFKSKFF